MKYLWFEQVSITDTVKDVTALNIPPNATHAEIQADRANSATGVRYTFDPTVPPTTTAGMLLIPTNDPKTVEIDTLRDIVFIRDGTVATALNIHYFAGRDV